MNSISPELNLMIKELEKYEVKYLFVVTYKNGKSIGRNKPIYPLSGIYFLFFVLYSIIINKP